MKLESCLSGLKVGSESNFTLVKLRETERANQKATLEFLKCASAGSEADEVVLSFGLQQFQLTEGQTVRNTHSSKSSCPPQ